MKWLTKVASFLSHIGTSISEWLDKKERTTVIFLLPYVTLFLVFIVLPTIIAILLSFTYFNGINVPFFVGFENYLHFLTNDDVFMQKVLPNTIVFSVIAGPGGYILSFVLAWILAHIQHRPRTIFAIILYSPSLTAGVTMAVLWKVIFSGASEGLMNTWLLNLGLINDPVQWLQSPDYLMPIMLIVTLWSSMGVGFLAILAGILGVNRELYQAAYMDGIRNKFQEMVYITIPSVHKQMLFGAVMSIVGTFTAGSIGVSLSGSNPTPQNSGQLILNHIEDYGVLRSELGMAAALSVILLFVIYFFSWLFQRVLSKSGDQ